MAALKFPLNPVRGAIYTGNNGSTYVFDGIKWVGNTTFGLSTQTNVLFNSGYYVQVTPDGGLSLPEYTLPSTTGTVGQVLQWTYISGTNYLIWADVRSQNSPREGSTGSFLISSTGSWVASINSDSSFTIPGALRFGDNTVQYTAYLGPPRIIPNIVTILTATQSTSTLTGSLITPGGIGIGGNGFFGGSINANSLNIAQNNIGTQTVASFSGGADKIVMQFNANLRKNSIISFNNTASEYAELILAASNIKFASNNSSSNVVINDGNVAIAGYLNVSNYLNIGSDLYIRNSGYINNAEIITTSTLKQYTVNSVRAGTDTVAAKNTSTGEVTIWNTSTLQSITRRGNTTSFAISILNNSPSNDVLTGALVVSGGVGIGKDVYVGGNIISENGLSIGSIDATGAIYAFEMYVNDSRVITEATQVGVSSLNNLSGALTIVAGTDNNIISTGTSITILNTSTLQSVTSRGSSTPALISITNNSSSTSTNTGALVVTGGVGIGRGLYVGGVITATNVYVNGYAVSTSTFNTGTLVAQAVSATSLVSGTWTFTVSSTGSVTLNGTPFVSGSGGTAASGTGTTTTFVISNITASTGTNSGALQVTGGVGIGGNLYAGDVYSNGIKLVPTNIQTFTATDQQSVFTINGGYNTGSVQVFANGILLAPIDYAASNGTTIVLNASRNLNDQISVISTPILGIGQSGGGTTFIGGTVTNAINVTSSTVSTSTTTGALVVAGGVGIGGNLYVGGTITANIVTLQYTTITTTSVTTDDVISTYNTTPTTSTNTGALIVAGGVGIGGGLYVGGAITATNVYVNGYAVSTNTNGATFTGGTVANAVNITSSTVSTSTTTGALTITGGVGIGGALYVRGTIYQNGVPVGSGGSLTAQYFGTPLGTVTTLNFATGTTATLIGTTLTIQISTSSGGGVAFNGGTVTNTVNITSSTVSISTNTGALTITGGVGIGGALFVGNTATIVSTATSTSTNTGALQVAGGVGIGGNVYAAGNIDAESFTILGSPAAIITSAGGLRPVYTTSTLYVAQIEPRFYGQYNINNLKSNLLISANSIDVLDGQRLIIRILSTGTYALSYDEFWFRGVGFTPPNTTIPDSYLYIGAIYNELDDYWDILTYTQQ
jgi:hypothetical protein